MALERQDLTGKVAIVTGGGRGVGRGIARVLSEAGAKVVLTARTVEQLDRSVSEIEERGGTVMGVPSDATKLEDVQRTVDATLERFGRIDIMINNVGGTTYCPSFDDITAENFISDLQLNVISAFHFMKLTRPHMKKNGNGSVVNISSRASGGFGTEGFIPYSITKLGLEQLTRMASRVFAPEIRVNCISLGTIEATWMSGERMTEEARRAIAAQSPMKRVGDPEDIGLAALYLCSDGCYANGTVLNIDGGLYEQMKL